MKAWRSVRRSVIVLAVSLTATGAFAQAPTQSPAKAQQPPFQPQVGQAGKDVVWVPTPQQLVDTMLDTAKVTPQDYVIDLGSGDGRTVITAAKRGARAQGIEYNPEMVALSKANAEKEGVSDRATFTKADLFETDLSQATVITMFLLPTINLKLRPTVLELKPGTRVVSNSFDMGDWVPDERQTVENGCSSWCTALMWIVPARVEGVWSLGNGQLTLKQEFQMLTGTLETGGNSVPVADGRLRGADITFTAGGTQYVGRVDGAAMGGTARTGDKDTPWKATKAGM